jgi:hypothetical protein
MQKPLSGRILEKEAIFWGAMKKESPGKICHK